LLRRKRPWVGCPPPCTPASKLSAPRSRPVIQDRRHFPHCNHQASIHPPIHPSMHLSVHNLYAKTQPSANHPIHSPIRPHMHLEISVNLTSSSLPILSFIHPPKNPKPTHPSHGITYASTNPLVYSPIHSLSHPPTPALTLLCIRPSAICLCINPHMYP
jgi:hypothetical protein